MTAAPKASPGPTHERWVRLTHGTTALMALTLAVSGFLILRVHPRLYWGETGNDLTPALIEFPIAPNYPSDSYTEPTRFAGMPASAVTATRTREPWNENGWARSLHFLAAWLLILPGLMYLTLGLSAGHFRRHLVPRSTDLAGPVLKRELIDHLRLRIAPATGGPAYGAFQKIAYSGVVFLVVPVIILSGLTMAPAATAAWPWLLDLFGGHQSARTIHFFGFVGLVGFVAVHVVMVVLSGFGTQLRGMTIGRKE